MRETGNNTEMFHEDEEICETRPSYLGFTVHMDETCIHITRKTMQILGCFPSY